MAKKAIEPDDGGWGSAFPIDLETLPLPPRVRDWVRLRSGKWVDLGRFRQGLVRNMIREQLAVLGETNG